MKRILIFLLLILPTFVEAQRVEVVAVDKTYGTVRRSTTASSNEDLYIAIFAYGLPREIVRTNSEMRGSVYAGTLYEQPADNATVSAQAGVSVAVDGFIGARGVTQRHHTTKGVDHSITETGDYPNGVGHNVNNKISFCYLVAPYNVNEDGTPDEGSTVELSWVKASGWDYSLETEQSDTGSSDDSGDGIGVGKGKSTLNTTPTGCAAYKGLGGKDLNGTWRLPTQRESQVMFTIMEQAMGLVSTYGVQNAITPGVFWTSTELFASGFAWKAWSNNSTSGSVSNIEKNGVFYARCVRDVYFKVNEVTVKK